MAFSQKFMDVIVKEIEDNIIRERVVEQLGDLLDNEVAPTLEERTMVEAEWEEVGEDKKK